jgi:hypothetical protein
MHPTTAKALQHYRLAELHHQASTPRGPATHAPTPASAPVAPDGPPIDALQPGAPLAVRNAARVMYTGAAAALIYIVAEFMTASATKTALGRRYPRLSASELTAAARFTVISEAVVALIAAVLFVGIARACTHGKNWARITGTVLCGLGIVEALIDLTVPGLRAGRSPADLIVSFVVAGLGLISVCILWQRRSAAYFRPLRRPGI